MYVKVFNKSEHLNRLRQWIVLRELPESLLENLPERGFIGYDGETAIGAVFLRRCEGKIVILDGLITNPESSKECRDKILDLLVNQAIDTARTLGATTVAGFIVDENTKARALRFGFEQNPYAILAMRLS